MSTDQTLKTVEETIASLPKGLKENAQTLWELQNTKIEGIGDEDKNYRIPFLKMIQPTTAEVPDGASNGGLVVDQEVLGAKRGASIDVIPLRMWTSRQYWDPDPNNPRQLCNSPDAKVGYNFGKCYGCEFAKWVDGKGAACNKQLNFLAITADFKHLINIGFTKGQFKFGKEWESILSKAGVSTYKRVYTLTSEKHPNAPTNVLRPGISDKKVDPKTMSYLEALFQMVKEDRQETLTGFYEGVKRRAENQASEPQPAKADTSEDKAIEPEAAPEAAQDDGAKQYSL